MRPEALPGLTEEKILILNLSGHRKKDVPQIEERMDAGTISMQEYVSARRKNQERHPGNGMPFLVFVKVHFFLENRLYYIFFSSMNNMIL